MRFAAFVMTYERPGIIADTIGKILGQSRPPEKLLVVDNSDSTRTEAIIRELANDRVQYLRVGYNSGPAGAAKIGLERLAAEGYDWIYWGDDDDPPKSPQTFATLLACVEGRSDIGAIGSTGGRLNRWTGRTRTLSNSELVGLTPVDFIAGGKHLIVNAVPVRNSAVLPRADLFFGFEDLDFCLKMKRAGYGVYVDGDTLRRQRINSGNSEPSFRWKGKGFGKSAPSKRNYYSVRSMLIILRSNRLNTAAAFVFLKTIVKMFVGFGYGFNYGKQAFLLNFQALRDFLLNRRQSPGIR